MVQFYSIYSLWYFKRFTAIYAPSPIVCRRVRKHKGTTRFNLFEHLFPKHWAERVLEIYLQDHLVLVGSPRFAGAPPLKKRGGWLFAWPLLAELFVFFFWIVGFF